MESYTSSHMPFSLKGSFHGKSAAMITLPLRMIHTLKNWRKSSECRTLEKPEAEEDHYGSKP